MINITILCPICQSPVSFNDIELNNYKIYHCSQCELRFAPEAADSKVDYTAIYETPEYIANQIDSIEKIADPKIFTQMPTYRPFFRKVKNEGGLNLIDVGCGVGRFLQGAYLKGWNVTGVDVSLTAISIGSKYAKFPMHHCSLEDMLNKQERYHVITCFEVLEHISDPLKFLNLCKSLLKKNGKIFCTVPNWDCSEVRNTRNKDWLPPIHVNFFTDKTLNYLLDRSGFKTISSGLIWTDPLPERFFLKIKWFLRRLTHDPRQPLGLWAYAEL